MDTKKEFKKAELAMKKALKEAKEKKNSGQPAQKPKVSITSSAV